MPRPPIWDSLWRYLESDTGFYVAVGVLTILVFVVALVVVTLVSPVSLTEGGLLGIVVGFGLFMAVFFVSIVAQRLEDKE
ncbi:hypothetical protein ACLI4Y_06915 [Natrialbaceae archaeon A-CW3]